MYRLATCLPVLLFMLVELTRSELNYKDLISKPHKRFFGLENLLGKHQVKFSWSNCGNNNDPIQVSQISLQPSPLTIPGIVKVSASANVQQDIKDFSIDVSLEKNFIGIWVPIPCEDGFGSCTYPSACAMIPDPCPPPIKQAGLPCKCPVNKGKYKLPLSSFKVNPPKIPHWLEEGKYKVKATLSSSQGRLACIEMQLSLS